jgi:hypothetical protein
MFSTGLAHSPVCSQFTAAFLNDDLALSSVNRDAKTQEEVLHHQSSRYSKPGATFDHSA